MEKDQIDFLKNLINTPSPSGFEEKSATSFLERIRDRVDQCYKDVHGNAFGVVNPEGKVKVMLAGHCDEIGMMVEYINDRGIYLFFYGGGNRCSYSSRERVLVHTSKERYRG